MRVHIHSNILTALLLIAVTSQTTHSRPAVPTADAAHSRHRRNAADLGDLTAAQAGILNVDCKYLLMCLVDIGYFRNLYSACVNVKLD